MSALIQTDEAKSMTSAVTIRVDSELKAEVEELFDDIGLNMTTAITCFLKKCVAVQGIPFELSGKPKQKTAGQEPRNP